MPGAHDDLVAGAYILVKAEPSKLRYRLLHTAAHMASIERRTQLRIAQPGLTPQLWPPWPHLATLPGV